MLAEEDQEEPASSSQAAASVPDRSRRYVAGALWALRSSQLPC